MADEPTQAPDDVQDTPTPDAPDTPQAPESPETDAPTQDEIDYQKRYQDLQPEYTRATQEAAQYRQIIELAQQGDPEALELLGLEAAQDLEDDDADPDAPLTRAEFEQFQQAQQDQIDAQEAQEAFLVDVNTGIEAIEEKEGRTLSDAETQFVLAQAEAQLRSGQQMDIEAAFAPIEDMSKSAIDRYVKSKKTASVPPLGSAGEDKIDLSDDDARQEYLAQVMQAEAQREA